jgi:rSAM/selenodomain-associated transferase 2
MASPLSIIIPAFNESSFLKDTLTVLADTPKREIIVVDGGSIDTTREIAVDSGARVVTAPLGRAKQMNAGAAAARGEILFFLHADSKPPKGFFDSIYGTLHSPGCAAGAFSLAIDDAKWRFRIIEKLVWFRSTLFHLPYGDQGLFLTAETFKSLGGFPELPIMEDFVFVKKLRRLGRIEILSKTITTSARRWQRMGVLKTTLVNQCIIAGYLLGVSPERLAEWYRRPSTHERW